jgi:FMN phosphatase YigB (HAD superfamily)
MDDSLRNVASARTELGISTVLVSPEGKKFWACPLVFLASLELAFN